jgi:hypothetical protein
MQYKVKLGRLHSISNHIQIVICIALLCVMLIRTIFQKRNAELRDNASLLVNNC